MKGKADIGVIGLAVMGQNLVLNINDRGYSAAVYNRTTSKISDFLSGPAEGRDTVYGAEDLEEFADLLERPRKVMLMVKAGEVVDQFIQMILPYLEQGDVIIDGGNSHYQDTTRRTRYLRERGVYFVGAGISGGEQGAREGPSIMPGGNREAWPLVRDIFQSIAARNDEGEICCDWVGADGAGHYVKMVHNGIEYGDMQLICEAYNLMKQVLNLSHEEMHRVFAEWNKGELNSYLIEITAEIMTRRDSDGTALLEKIRDTAGEKGTGKWTGVSSMELGVPVTLIGEAVYARFLSSMKDQREEASRVLKGPDPAFSKEETGSSIEDIRQALYASKIISYAQGYMLMSKAGYSMGWDLNFSGIARMWSGGCIIRSAFLKDIQSAFNRNKELSTLLMDDYFSEILNRCQESLRNVVTSSVRHAVPVPAFSTALSFYDGYRSSRLPANLLQAQRDYFGAHTYERIDRKPGEFFHTDWTKRED